MDCGASGERCGDCAVGEERSASLVLRRDNSDAGAGVEGHLEVESTWRYAAPLEGMTSDALASGQISGTRICFARDLSTLGLATT